METTTGPGFKLEVLSELLPDWERFQARLGRSPAREDALWFFKVCNVAEVARLSLLEDGEWKQQELPGCSRRGGRAAEAGGGVSGGASGGSSGGGLLGTWGRRIGDLFGRQQQQAHRSARSQAGVLFLALLLLGGGWWGSGRLRAGATGWELPTGLDVDGVCAAVFVRWPTYGLRPAGSSPDLLHLNRTTCLGLQTQAARQGPVPPLPLPPPAPSSQLGMELRALMHCLPDAALHVSMSSWWERRLAAAAPLPSSQSSGGLAAAGSLAVPPAEAGGIAGRGGIAGPIAVLPAEAGGTTSVDGTAGGEEDAAAGSLEDTDGGATNLSNEALQHANWQGMRFIVVLRKLAVAYTGCCSVLAIYMSMIKPKVRHVVMAAMYGYATVHMLWRADT